MHVLVCEHPKYMNLPNINPAELAGLSPDEVISRFGGEDRAKELLRWCRYNTTIPVEARPA